MSGKRVDRSARMRVYLTHLVGIKWVLVTIGLISATTCTIVNGPKVKDVATTEPDHRVTPPRVPAARLWWSREKRSLVENVERRGKSLEAPRAFGIRYLESAVPRSRRIGSSNVKTKQKRRDGTCPTVDAALATFRDSLEGNGHLALCDTTKCCYRLLQQGWGVKTSLYAEEPSWIGIDIDIGQDYGESIRYRDRLLRTIDISDPFVVARGKRIGEPSGREVFDTSCNGRTESGTSMPNKRDFNATSTGGFGGAAKRTRADDRRAILRDILSMSDPFYAARGKRQNTRPKAQDFDRWLMFERHRHFLQSSFVSYQCTGRRTEVDNPHCRVSYIRSLNMTRAGRP